MLLEGCQGMSGVKKHTLGHLADPHWSIHVTNIDLRVDNDWELLILDQAALNGCKETQPHTDCQHGNP